MISCQAEIGVRKRSTIHLAVGATDLDLMRVENGQYTLKVGNTMGTIGGVAYIGLTRNAAQALINLLQENLK